MTTSGSLSEMCTEGILKFEAKVKQVISRRHLQAFMKSPLIVEPS